MPKSPDNIHDLNEADFREIQKLLIKKYQRAYTVGYVRKVCKALRNNTTIEAMAEEYLKVKQEMHKKIERLSNQ